MPWERLLPESALAPGAMTRVFAAGKPVLVARARDGRLFAADDACPHAGAPLHRGALAGTRVSCYLHLAAFDLAEEGRMVRTGGIGTVALRTFPVKVEEGHVWADVPEGRPPLPGALRPR